MYTGVCELGKHNIFHILPPNRHFPPPSACNNKFSKNLLHEYCITQVPTGGGTVWYKALELRASSFGASSFHWKHTNANVMGNTRMENESENHFKNVK